MKSNPLVLRCYAHPENDYILGVCIDLNIAVRASSVQEVKKKMTEAITLHFKSLNAENFRDLCVRPAPFKFWADYYRIFLLVNIHTFRKKSAIFFEQIIPQKFSVSPCV